MDIVVKDKSISDTPDIDHPTTIDPYKSYVIDGVLSHTIKNYNEFVLSNRKMWRIPENELKVYIIETKIIPHLCKLCGQIPKWNNKPLDLVLDRINNEILDNNIGNLRFLCPNCYCQIKKKSSIFEKNNASKMIRCLKCGKRIKYKTFSVNKHTNIEHYCKLCLEQEKIEAKLNSRKVYPK